VKTETSAITREAVDRAKARMHLAVGAHPGDKEIANKAVVRPARKCVMRRQESLANV
jgi:hypothetical protein